MLTGTVSVLLMMLLQCTAAIAFAWCRDWVRATYWVGALLLTGATLRM